MSQPKILIVDDEATTREIVKKILEDQDYLCIIAEDGPEGLEKAEQENPDSILLDQLMPEMNGDEVLEKLKSNDNTKDIPVIMLTAKNDIKDVAKSLELGAIDYVVKPFDKDNLVVRLKHALNNDAY